MPTFLAQFYATKADMHDAMRRVESVIDVEYVLTGMFRQPGVTRYRTWRGLPNLGTSMLGEHLLEPRYIAVPPGSRIIPETIPQRRGGILYSIDSHCGPASVIFHPGGEFSQNVIISGELGTNRADAVSKEIARAFKREFFKGFQKIHAYRLGPEAAKRLDSGWRLTPGIKWSREVDLKRPSPSLRARVNGGNDAG